MKNTNDFSKCKVGDKLWSIQLGECEITQFDNNLIKCSSSVVSGYGWYSNTGKYCTDDLYQSLFFSNPEIIAPEKPKIRIPFDLQKALENPDSLVTRDSRKVVEWKWFEKADQDDPCIVALIENEETINMFFIDNGNHYTGDITDSCLDLFIEE